ncbi:hypothetical protein AS156_06660 [Bradyrhizobium macuxiense]|uniref:Uncharacterized protein n=1 Tax=Bradyrhizobium macuxiense TaxID=1755647 RepID=A0A109JT43_9BRAD|nr:hypothetical protein AS156_06660 [Bradyrhizobium macuxiense]
MAYRASYAFASDATDCPSWPISESDETVFQYVGSKGQANNSMLSLGTIRGATAYFECRVACRNFPLPNGKR